MTRPILPGRFEPIQFLRETATVTTFVAADHTLHLNDVVARILRKGHFPRDPRRLFEMFFWYRGMRHRHLCSMLDAGLTPTRDLFCVRPHLETTSLFVQRDTASLKHLLGVIQFLHTRGIVHGAIKPSNVFGRNESLQLADPWLAANWRKPETTEEVRFTAPEVLAGGVRTVEADLYSVGALLYRFYSGRDLFDDADLDLLLRKYAWAAPRPLSAVCHVSQNLAEIVGDLIHKDPSRRPPAFASLRHELGIRPITALRAPATGGTAVLEHTGEFLRARSRSKRVVLLIGPVGSGKTRFIEELGSRLSFTPGAPRLALCPPAGRGGEKALARWVVSLFEERHPADDSVPAVQRLNEALAAEPVEKSREATKGVLHDDLLQVMGVLSHRSPTIFVFEDIDRSNRSIASFLETVARRAGTTPVSLLLTTRQSDVPQKAIRTLASCLGLGFLEARLPLLDAQHAKKLVSFLVEDEERGQHVRERSGGNPCFLEDFSRAEKPGMPRRVGDAVKWLLGAVPQQSRRTLEGLSIFEGPVDLATVQQVTQIPETELTRDIALLQRLGLVGEHREILYSDARQQVYGRVPKPRRAALHARAFDLLNHEGTDAAQLARHAQMAGRPESQALYLELATAAFSKRDFRAAASLYELAAASEKGGNRLDPGDSLLLARCYGYIGRRTLSRRILQRLQRQKAVREDRELLSSVYSALASPLVEKSVSRAVHLLRLSVQGIEPDSPSFAVRHRALAGSMLNYGRPTAAAEVVRAARVLCVRQEDQDLLDDFLAFIQMDSGKFQEAAVGFGKVNRRHLSEATRLCNLAVCKEQLGDIDGAAAVQSAALTRARAEGLVIVEIAALGNLSAMETKRGNMAAAESFLTLAFRRFEEVRQSTGSPHILGSLFTDAATHWMLRGQFLRAIECLEKHQSLKSAGSSAVENFHIAKVKGELAAKLGDRRKAVSILRQMERTRPREDFFRIESLLFRVSLCGPQAEILAELEQAVVVARQQGRRIQECTLLIEAALVSFALGRKGAEASARQALLIAEAQDYAPLAVQCFLILGQTLQNTVERDFYLGACISQATKMDLSPLLAEAFFQVGALRVETGNYAEARDYLSRCAGLISKMACGLDERRQFMTTTRHEDVMKLLQEIPERIEASQERPRASFEQDSFFFNALYRLATAAAWSGSFTEIVQSLVTSLESSVSGEPSIVMKRGAGVVVHTDRDRESTEYKERAHAAFNRAEGRPAFSEIIGKGERRLGIFVPVGPMPSTVGIYVEYPDGLATMEEREMEFLTLAGKLAASAFQEAEAASGVAASHQIEDLLGIVGKSPVIRVLRRQILAASQNSATVLIEGASGTGKELVARAIHQGGRRRDAPFIAVDCGALPDTLIEAELFGTRKGAYTGAQEDRPGLFEAANGGSVFLDEISSAGGPLQSKLLRAIQERAVRRVGEVHARPVDFRLIAATNRSLQDMMDRGEFRRDLFFRLNVLTIRVPSLSERREDVPLLAEWFLRRLNEVHGRSLKFTSGLLEGLAGYTFPGNVRELQNIVERAFHTESSTMITEIDVENPPSSTNGLIDWFKDIAEGRTDFWTSVRDRFRQRNVSRERVQALVAFGLKQTSGNYRALASTFRMVDSDYRRFMDFLRRNQCLLDFRPFRKENPGS